MILATRTAACSSNLGIVKRALYKSSCSKVVFEISQYSMENTFVGVQHRTPRVTAPASFNGDQSNVTFSIAIIVI